MNYDKLLNQMNKISAGDHLVFLYDDKITNYNIQVIIAYIISRLKKNEKVFYIYGDMDSKLFSNEISKYGIIVEALEKGQLSILSKEESYSKNGVFDQVNMIRLLKKLTLEALNQGYEAFAITGELSWVLGYEDGFKKIMDYEYLLNNEIFGSYPVSAVCRYNIDKFSNKMIKNVIDVHPFVIWDGKIHQNPFYFDIVNTNYIDVDKYYVDKMLERIVDFTETRSRFNVAIQDKEKELNSLQMNLLKNMIVTLSGLLEIHDKYTKNHSENVANIAKLIASNMNLSQNDITQIYYAGLVHDIGKTIIPQEILNKNGRLTEDEYELVMKHSSHGFDVLSKSGELQNIANLVLEHHERIDGKGYPLGIKGDKILVGAKILAVADSFDAMTSDRSYRSALSISEAIEEIRKNKNLQFDAEIAEIAIDKIFKYM